MRFFLTMKRYFIQNICHFPKIRTNNTKLPFLAEQSANMELSANISFYGYLRILWDNKSPFDKKYEIFGKKMGDIVMYRPKVIPVYT